MLYEQTNPQYQLETDRVYDALDGLSPSDQRRVANAASSTKMELDSISKLKANKLARRTYSTSGVGEIGVLEIVIKIAMMQQAIEEGLGNDLKNPSVIKALVNQI